MNETPPKMADILATERTRMAADRTLIGGMRTALSMIGFGFTIYQVSGISSSPKKWASEIVIEAAFPAGRRAYLLSLGLFSLIIACLQHWQLCKETEGGSAL